jgi:hypothetical protein
MYLVFDLQSKLTVEPGIKRAAIRARKFFFVKLILFSLKKPLTIASAHIFIISFYLYNEMIYKICIL